MPSVGDVISFAYDSAFDAPDSNPGHVAIVTAVSDSYVTIVGENQNGSGPGYTAGPAKLTIGSDGHLVSFDRNANIEWLHLAGSVAADATNKVVRVQSNGNAYLFDGSKLHWVPDGNTYFCLRDGGTAQYDVATQGEADALGDGKPWVPECLSLQRVVGHIVREVHSGTAYTVTADGTSHGLWHWIPDGNTYNCLLGSMSKVDATWTEIVSLRGAAGSNGAGSNEGSHASCQTDRDKLVAAATNKVVHVQANGNSYFFDGSKLHWIPDANTYYCMVDGGKAVYDVAAQATVDSLGDGKPWQAECLSQQRVSGHIVRASDGTAYTVTSDSKWHWIPDGATYSCLLGSMSKVDATWTEIVSLRGASGSNGAGANEGAHATCQSDHDKLVAAATNKVVHVQANGNSYFFDGSKLHWIPDANTYYCMVDAGKSVYEVAAQATADSLGDGKPWQAECLSQQRVSGHIVRASDGTAYTVTSDGKWHWIPDGATYSCLLGSMSKIDATWTEVNSLRGASGQNEGSHATCQTTHEKLVADGTNKILSVSGGPSYFFDGSTLHWIPDTQTYWCLADGGKQTMAVTQAQADSLGDGKPWESECLSLQRILGHVVRESTSGASYVVTDNGTTHGLWHWIPDGGTYNCLIGANPVIESNWTQINSLRGANGQNEGSHATCSTASSKPAFTVMNTSDPPPDGVYFRNSPHTSDTDRVTGHGVYANDRVELECYGWGDAVGPYGDTLWYYVTNLTHTSVAGHANVGWLNAHYINDGKPTNQVDVGVPAC